MIKPLLVSLLLLSCSSSDYQVQEDASVCRETRRDIRIPIDRELDILIVLDTSPSMTDETEALTANLSRFANVLQSREGGLPNVHIGVVSSDVVEGQGILHASDTSGPCFQSEQKYLSDIRYLNGERERNYTTTLVESLACMATLPSGTSGIEQPLEAMKRALDGSNPENEGFSRDQASLLVLIVSDEDDCSGGQSLASDSTESNTAWRCFADSVQCDQPVDTPGIKTGCQATETPSTLTPLASYVDFLRARKDDPGQVIVAAVTSGVVVNVLVDSEPSLASSCEDSGSARPAIRLDSFLDSFPQRNSHADICADNWSDALIVIASSLSEGPGAPACVSNADLDPVEPGLQHECVVSRIQNLATNEQSEVLIPECSQADLANDERTCWQIAKEPGCVRYGGFAVQVRWGRELIQGSALVRVRCHEGC